MWLTKVAINRRVTISMVIVFLIVLGVVGLSRMPWDLNPNVDIPIISVTIPYPGAGPQEVEQRVLRPVEDAVSIINGVDTVDSVAYENLGNVTISFNYNVKIDVVAADVRDALDRAKAKFPTEVKPASLYKIDIGAQPVLTVGITGQRPPRDLRKLVDDDIQPRLGQVPGVAAVSVTGGEEREIQVLAHRERLDAVGLSIAQLAQLLQAENLDVPSGSIKEGTRDYAVRVLGEFKSMQEIRNVEIHTPGGGIVPLSSIADVQDTVVEPQYYARVDGEPSVTVNIVKQSGSNTVTVVQGVRKELEALVGKLEGTEGGGELPSDIHVVVAQDQSERVIEAIKDVRDALMWGALLAAFVTFLFLHNLRGTLIVACAIPTSMLATFLPVGMGFGFTLNTMVMLALSLSVGILVDDSIVVLENITRHLEKGEQPQAAAFNGRTEIGGAAVAITLVDVVVFIPVAMMGGIVGRFFYPFGITAFICTLFSLFVSFTLTPMLASWWYTRLGKGDHASRGLAQAFFNLWDRGYGGLERAYRAVLRRAIRHPFLVVLTGFAILIVVVMNVGKGLGERFEFFPASDAGLVNVSVETAVGTRLEETDRIIHNIETRLLDKQKYPEIMHVSTVAGTQGGGIVGAGKTGGQYGQLSITMSRMRQRRTAKPPQRSDQDLARDLRQDLADIPSAIIKVSTQGGMGGGGGGADVELNVMCEDQDLLASASTDLMHEVQKINGLLYVDLSSKPGRPEIHAKIDRRRAADLGISAAQIGTTVRTAIAGDDTAKFRESGDEYALRVQLTDFDRRSVRDVASLFVGLTPTGQPVRLMDVAQVFMSTGPSQIERYNRQRKVTLSATLDRRILASGGARQQVQAILDKTNVPGVNARWAGSVKMMVESMMFLFQALLLAVALVYIVTAALYNSTLQPMTVMLTLPMALVGAMVGLTLAHMTMSLVAMIGIIMLMGLVGKNAILVVDYTNTLRARGLARTEALLEAGPIRMKPVLMTTTATIMGMMPTALARNEGSEWRQPMAVVVISGLIVATVLSLLVVPASYEIWDQLGEFIGRIGRGLTRLLGLAKKGHGGGDEPPEPPAAAPADEPASAAPPATEPESPPPEAAPKPEPAAVPSPPEPTEPAAPAPHADAPSTEAPPEAGAPEKSAEAGEDNGSN